MVPSPVGLDQNVRFAQLCQTASFSFKETRWPTLVVVETDFANA